MSAGARAGHSLGEMFALNSITFVRGVGLKLFVKGRFLQSIIKHKVIQCVAEGLGQFPYSSL